MISKRTTGRIRPVTLTAPLDTTASTGGTVKEAVRSQNVQLAEFDQLS